MSDPPFLSRWSRRKIAARQGELPPQAAPPEASPPAAAPADSTAADPVVEAAPPLPPVESLTPESDFTPFMGKTVDASLKRRALKTLFSDPRFNVMDGLDVYIDDYSKPDPLPEGWLEKLNQVARLGDYHPPEDAVTKEAGSDEPAPEAPPASQASGESPVPSPVDDSTLQSSPPQVPES